MIKYRIQNVDAVRFFQVMRELGMSHNTYFRYVREFKAEN